MIYNQNHESPLYVKDNSIAWFSPPTRRWRDIKNIIEYQYFRKLLSTDSETIFSDILKYSPIFLDTRALRGRRKRPSQGTGPPT